MLFVPSPPRFSSRLRIAILLSVAVALSIALVRTQIPTDVVAHWKLDESAPSQTAADSSGNGHDGMLVNGPTWTSSGHIDGALAFDGTGQHVLITGTALLEPAKYAISAWVRYTTTGPSGGDVVSMGDNYGLRVQPNGEVKTYYYKGNSSWNVAVSAGVTTHDGSWHHIVGQFTGSSLQVYIDGVKGDDRQVADPITYGLGSDLYIGKHGNGGANHNFNGTIDQIRVYPRELTETEIAALASEGSPEATSVTVLTWNLRKGRATDNSDSVADNSIADWIATTSGADVLLLSAVQTDAEAAAIKNRLNAWGGSWDYYWQKSSNATEGQAVIARYPMPTSSGDRDFIEVTCPNETERQVLVKAVAVINGTPVNFFALDQQHGSSREAVRECQAQQFSSWAASFAEPRIIGGDFNAVPTDLGFTTWISADYWDTWSNAITRIGYPAEGSSIGNDASSSIFGRTRKNRIDYIITSPQLTVTEARVWDVRKAGTTCNDLASDGFIGVTCSGDCSSCQYVDDKAVRPTDHIPVTAVVQVQ